MSTLSSLSRLYADGVDAATRKRGIAALMEFNRLPFEYAKDLDECVVETKPLRSMYILETKRLMFNVAVNPKLQEFPASRLTYLSDEELANGTIIQRVQEQEKQRHEAYVNMLKEKSDAIISDQNESVIHCRKCGSANLNFVQVQTRSADEPMTCLFGCNSCGLKWRMN